MLKNRSWTKVAALGAIASVATFAAFSTATAVAQNLRGTVRIDGSSTVYPITAAIAEEFSNAAPRVRVTVGVSGTGGGMKRFTIGETDISNASRPIKAKEYKVAMENDVEFIEVPVAYDGLTIVVNKSNTWVDHMTVDELKSIFLEDRAAKTWADVRPGWPDRPITMYAPGTDSGTFDYFKEVVAGKTGSIRSDMSVSEDDNVLITGVTGDVNGIGFFGCAYYFENVDKLKVVPIDGGAGPVEPTPTTIEDGTYAPFSRPLFIYVNKKSLDKPEVAAFVEYYMENAAKYAAEVGYVGLPSEIYERANARINFGLTGSQFLTSTMEKISGSLPEVYR